MSHLLSPLISILSSWKVPVSFPILPVWKAPDSRSYHGSSPTVSALSIREAKPLDLDAMTEIMLAAFPFDPQWQYRYPYASEFPQDSYKYSRLRLSEYLNDAVAGLYQIFLVESPTNEDPAKRRVVAFAIYQLPGHHRNSGVQVFPFSNFTVSCLSF